MTHLAMPTTWLPVFLACGSASCSIWSMLSDSRTPADHAHAVESRCRDFADAGASKLLSPDSVDSVEPAYSYVQSGNDRRPNLRGARIQIKPLPGLALQSMTRTLECHQAAVILRGEASPADDPYVLPGRWVDFDVSSADDGFVILARVISIEDARLVLARAKRFAASASRP
jgi:hypothetical protein